MGPSADACRRFALMLKMAHVKFVVRNIAAFQHTQNRDQGLHLDLCEAEFRCGLETLCQHIVLLPISIPGVPTPFRNLNHWTDYRAARAVPKPRNPRMPVHASGLAPRAIAAAMLA